MEVFRIKQNDTRPFYELDLLDANGDPAPLVGDEEIFFNMRPYGSATPKVDNGVMSIIALATATVRYEWDETDTDDSGWFNGEVEVIFADGTRETFPNGSDTPIRISPDIA